MAETLGKNSSTSVLIVGVGTILLFAMMVKLGSAASISSVSSTSLTPIKTVDDLINRLIRVGCPHSYCKGSECELVTEKRGCQLCACPIGSRSRGCDQMPFALWYDIMTNGCPNDTIAGDQLTRYPVKKVTRWYRKINRATGVDECSGYEFPYCADLDFNLWRSPETPGDCLQDCYSVEERREYQLRHQLLSPNGSNDNSTNKQHR